MPMVPPKSSRVYQTATQFPAPSEARLGLVSSPRSVVALPFEAVIKVLDELKGELHADCPGLKFAIFYREILRGACSGPK